MTVSWRTVRVFISSTFKDMQAERDHLVRFVFPKLREELLHRRIHFVDVDLRWGVTSEQDSLQVCKEIIDECRPRFLCMLGGRYGWTPPGREESITAAEVRCGVLDRLGEHGYAFFYFRDPAATASMVEARPGEFREPPGSPNERKLAALKSAIAGTGLNPFVYPATWDNRTSRLTGLKAFGDQVYADLMRSIDKELGTQPPQKLDEFAEENAAMEVFVGERTERFVLGSRESVLKELLAHASATGGDGYLCLTGAPGSGKSALLAHLYRWLQSPARSFPPSFVIAHFVGASPGSTNMYRTLRRLCHELKASCPNITGKIPDDPERLQTAFPDFLRQACEKKHVVILLDAINQFDQTSGISGLYWLPDELPTNARFILSALDGPALEELRRRYHPPREIELKPLTAADGEAIIEQFRQRYRKRFEPGQRTSLLAKIDAGTPLYLLAALEELRTLGTYEEITSRIAELPPDTQALFTWILKRLENDEGFRDPAGRKIGQELVPRFASLLGASRYGLSQCELTDLLAPDDPQGNVAALSHLLRPYLMRRGELLDFYHGQFRVAAERAYLESDIQRHAAHAELADYFRHKADPDHDRSWKGRTPRPFLEMPFHLARADPDKLTEILFQYCWLRSKLNATDGNELIADYDLIDDPGARSIQGAIRLSSHILAQDPSHLPSQLFARLLSQEDNRIKGLLTGSARDEEHPWLMPLAATLPSPDGPLLRTLAGHRGGVESVAVTPDGRHAVSGSYDKTLKVWELASGRAVQTLVGHEGDVTAVAVTPDGRYAVSGSDDRTLRVWELASGRVIHTLADGECVTAVAVTPDGRYAVSGSLDPTLKVWELASGKEIRALTGHHAWVCAVAVTPDGQYAVSGSDDKTLKVWELASGRAVRTLVGHEWGVRAVAITPDGRYAVSGSEDKMLKVWELASGRVVHTLAGHADRVTAVAVTPDGRYAVSGSEEGDKTLKIWELASGRAVRTLVGHVDGVSAVAVMPDGRQAISASWDWTLRAWELASGQAVRMPVGHADWVTAVAVTPDGRYAVSGSEDKMLKVWELASGRVIHTLAGHADRVTAVAVTPDGQYAVSGSGEYDKTLRIWELASGRAVRTLVGHEWEVRAVAITPDGRYAVSGSDDKTLKVWELASGRAVRTLVGHADQVTAVAVTPDGRYAVSGSHDKTLRVWGLASGRAVATLAGHKDWVASVAVTPDGCYAVSGSHDKTLKVWELASGRAVHTLAGHEDYVLAVAVTLDGRYAVSGSYDKTLKVWELASGRAIHTLAGHEVYVNAVVITPDARYVVSVSSDNTVRVWEAGNGKAVTSFCGDSAIHCCAVAPDGRTIVAGEASGRVHFLRLENVP